MKHQNLAYRNPRIDTANNCANALHGTVYFDFVKFIWVITMFTLGSIGSLLTVSVSAIVLFIGFTVTTLCLGHSLGMHRRFIHRSYQCPRWMEVFFVHLGTLVGLAGPLGMLNTHDLRDWAQRQSVCHDYFSHGKVWYHDAYWQLFCSIKLDHPPHIQPEPEIAKDKLYSWMEHTWMLQQLPWAVVFYFFGGWSWVFWGICTRTSISIFGHWLIGYFAHNKGQRDWQVDGAAVQGHNIPWSSLITMGENWHNNHHAFPGSAKLGLEEKQWDPGWWVLVLLEKAGFVSHLQTPEDAAYRPELIRI